MAQEQRDRLKEILFFAFVAISLVLVVLVWTDGLQADADSVPGYYRSSTPLEENEPSTGAPATPVPGGGATEEAPTEHRGSHQHEPPTSTPTGRNFDGEEM